MILYSVYGTRTGLGPWQQASPASVHQGAAALQSSLEKPPKKKETGSGSSLVNRRDMEELEDVLDDWFIESLQR